MKSLLHNRYVYIGVALTLISIMLLMVHGIGSGNGTEVITSTVEVGSVRQLVSVSGIAEAKQTAELAFPVTGIVKTVAVKTGDIVKTGDVLVTLDARALLADRQDALAALSRTVADRDELLQGPTLTAQDVTAAELAAKEAALRTTKETEEQKVANAYRTLLSSDLTTYSEDTDEDAVPPLLSGSYTCDTAGTYLIEVFSSKADSGYSYYLSGLESGTFPVSTDQPIALGTCGLRIIFDAASSYSRTTWHIDVPNLKSSQYVANRNAYALAVTQAESAIALAEQAVTLAKADATNQNAPARNEAIDRANADVAQAQARLNRIDSTIADRTLTAPFGGVITNIDILPGETVTTVPVVTLLANSEFDVTARIPEIDIGKLQTGQRVEMLFDARTTEVVTGAITFISPRATEIDGVAYYEAIIKFDTVPTWIRSGLNADIEIIISERTDSLRIPRRFLTTTDTGYEVLVLKDGTTATTTIEVLLEGNDGFVAITGLNQGDTIIAP